MPFLVPEAIESYAVDRSEGFSPLHHELIQVTRERTRYPSMLSGFVGGNLLRLLVRLLGARKVLEIGTFTGFGTLCLAEGLPEDGEVHTLELDAEHLAIAESFFQRSPWSERIHPHLGPAFETLCEFEGPFDLVFLDADKPRYPHYYQEALRLLRPGGLLVVDNALWSGEVLDPGESESARAIDELNRTIETDDRVEGVLLTVRDGIFLVRKR